MSERVKCPFCKQRLFDLRSKGVVELEIKCPKCKRIVSVIKHLSNNMHTEQRNQAV